MSSSRASFRADDATSDVPYIRDLLASYDDLPMDLADAALVGVDERERLRTIFSAPGKAWERGME